MPKTPINNHLPDPTSKTVTTSDQLHIVAIGTSAGGLAALSAILADLPADFPAPILVVQHVSASFPSQLAQILKPRTSLEVKQAQEGDHLQKGWVYIAPSGKHLLVRTDVTLALTTTKKIHHSRPSVDVLLISVAETFGSCAIAVVLTGGDGDGSDGIRAVRAVGGITIAQDQPSSYNPSMPRSAAATGDLDYVLPLKDIARTLRDLVVNSHGS